MTVNLSIEIQNRSSITTYPRRKLRIRLSKLFHIFYSIKIFLNFILRLPWNKRTLRGYFYEICFDSVFGDTYLLANSSLLLLFISICLHHKEFAKRLSHSLRKLDYDDKARNNKDFLCELMNFHISVKELVQLNQNSYNSNGVAINIFK